MKALYEKLGKDDDVFTMQEWLDMVKCGALIDYDGFGYYSDGKYAYRENWADVVRPSDADNVDKSFSHVVVP
jgi:hypothetical protein